MSKERQMNVYCATKCDKWGGCTITTMDAEDRFAICEDLRNHMQTLQKGESPKEMVNHPSHYNRYPIETIDMMVSVFGKEATRQWCLMTAFKYRMRLGLKDDIQQDLDKEQWYLNKAKELE